MGAALLPLCLPIHDRMDGNMNSSFTKESRISWRVTGKLDRSESMPTVLPMQAESPTVLTERFIEAIKTQAIEKWGEKRWVLN
jgi:hypothetical protein